MQKDTPVTDDFLNDEDALGDNLRLLILNKSFDEIFALEKTEKDGEEKK